MATTVDQGSLFLQTGKARVPLAIGQHHTIPAASGESYRLVKRTEGTGDEQLASDVVVHRSGADLQLDYADGTVVTLQGYYTVCGSGPACPVTVAGDAPEGYQLTASSALGAHLADGSAVLYAHGSPDTLAGMVPSHAGLDTPLAGLKGEQITYIPQDHNGLALVFGGALGLIAIGGSGGGGGAAVAAVAPASVNNFVKLNFVGGPAVAGNDLKVEIYKADAKTLLGTGSMAADGTVTVDVHDYAGVVVAKVINSGSSPDYLDEATGQPKDLSVQLFTMGVITDPNSTINVNVNILTTIAYTKALAAANGADLTPALVNDTAAAISKLFQVDDILHTGAVSTNGGSYNAADGLSAGEKYGAVLAAFSGADALGDGNSQDTLNTVLGGITLSTVNGSPVATITEAAQTNLVDGAKLAAAQSGNGTGNLTGDVSLIVDTYPPTFTSTATALVLNASIGTAQAAFTAAATDPSGVTYSLSGADAATFSIDPATGAVSFKAAPDPEHAAYSVTVIATDSAGNASQQALSITLNGPASAALVHDTGIAGDNSDLVTSNAAMSFSEPIAGIVRTYVVDGGAASSSYTAPALDGTHTVTAIDTDSAGHTQSAAVTFVLDTHAPTLSSSTPMDDATGVAAADNLTLSFNENVFAGAGSIKLVNDDNASDTRTIAVTDASQVSFSGHVLTINPTADLTGGAHYHIEVDPTAVLDAAGNAYAGISNSTSQNFLVGVVPVMISVSESGVWLDTNHNGVLDAGEQVLNSAAAVNGQLITAQGNAAIDFSHGAWTVEFWDVTGPAVNLAGFGADDKVVVNLAANTDTNGLFAGYFVGAGQRQQSNFANSLSGGISGGFDQGGFHRVGVDVYLSGHELQAFHGTYNRGFDSSRTLANHLSGGFDPAHVSGQLSFILPPDDYAAPPTVQLSSDTGSSNSDQVTNNPTLAVGHTESGATVEYSHDGTSWASSFTPVEGANTVYARETDLAGNVSAASSALHFTYDSTAPTLTSSTPADDDTGVAVGANLTLNFSEAVHAGTGNVHLVNDDNASDSRTIAITDTSQVSFSGDTMTINPTSDLAMNSHYHIEVDPTAVQDVAGNAFAGISDSTSHNFMTVGPMAAAPELISVSNAGVWLDANANGILDMGEQVLDASHPLNGQLVADQPGRAIDFSFASWNVEFWSSGGPSVDLSGFGSDDRITVKLDDLNSFFGHSPSFGGPWAGQSGADWGVAYEGGAQFRYAKVFVTGADHTQLESSYGTGYNPANHTAAHRFGVLATLASGLSPVHQPQFEFILPAPI